MAGQMNRSTQTPERHEQLAQLLDRGNQLHDQAVVDFFVNLVSGAMPRATRPFDTSGPANDIGDHG